MAGQTLSQIRALLADAGLAPQHRYGQNFLIDLNLMQKLAAAAALSADDTILEVGPGTGSLTEILLASGARVVAVEIDHGFQTLLRHRLGANPRFTLIQGDALAGKSRVNPLLLKVLAERLPQPGGALKLVANLPYQIATPLLVDLLLVQPRFACLACTIQKEVGERLGAAPGTEAYGPVSVVMQTLALVQPIAILPPAVFWPQPEVHSVMVRIEPKKPQDVAVDDVPGFVAFVRRAFQQRRKMLRRLFRDNDELTMLGAFRRAGVSPEARAEELEPLAWQALYRTMPPSAG